MSDKKNMSTQEEEIRKKIQDSMVEEEKAQSYFLSIADDIYENPGQAVYEIMKHGMMDGLWWTVSSLRHAPYDFGPPKNDLNQQPANANNQIAEAFNEYEVAVLKTMDAQDELDNLQNPKQKFSFSPSNEIQASQENDEDNEQEQ